MELLHKAQLAVGAAMKDEDGQPINRALNYRQRTGRGIDELLGICRGLAADGRVNIDEARFLEQWLALNGETAEQWPGRVLTQRLRTVLQDGKVNLTEERELLELLMSVTGGDASRLTAASLSATLPLTTPVPTVAVSANRFCFTGKFLLGSRNACHEAVVTRGGFAEDAITRNLNYLVVGVIGSRDWVHSSYGTKIQKAVDYRESGLPLAIIAEEHFVKALSL